MDTIEAGQRFEWSGKEGADVRGCGGARSRTAMLAIAIVLVGGCLLTVSEYFAPRPVFLGSLMSEFSPYAQSADVVSSGEMKASSDFYSDEGSAPKGPASAWTGDGGSAFNYLQSEASSPIDEAEADRQDTLDGDMPKDSTDDLYGSYLGKRGTRRGRERQAHTLQRLRAHEKTQRSQNDKYFFAGVSRVFGKKTGDFLMKKFDPTLKKKKKNNTRRRQPRDRSLNKRSSSSSSSSSPASDATLQHVGVIGNAERMKTLFAEFKAAKGGKRKALLKSKVMALQKQIEGDFAKVTLFGQAAETALKKAEKKEKKAQNKVLHRNHGHLMHIGDPL